MNNKKIHIFSIINKLLMYLIVLFTANVSSVELSTDGAGDLLFMPYYTVRDVQDRDGLPAGKYQTFLDITNTSKHTVAFRVNFREAQHGRSCGQIDIVLSGQDVWTAAIQETVNGVRLFSVDSSCTSPQMTVSGTGKEFLFDTNGFTGGNNPDVGPVTIDRCKEGFVEIIALGHSNLTNNTTLGTVANNALQNSNNIPKNCTAVEQAFEDAVKIPATQAEFKEPINSLKGMYTLINFDNGIAFGGEFVALANFYTPLIGDGTSASNLIDNIANKPDLNSGPPPHQSFTRIPGALNNPQLAPIESQSLTKVDTWNNSVDAVSAVLMRANIINQWTTNSNLGAETTWVVTMPTYDYYTKATAIPPFAESFKLNLNPSFKS